jgi:hypothetical protein
MPCSWRGPPTMVKRLLRFFRIYPRGLTVMVARNQYGQALGIRCMYVRGEASALTGISFDEPVAATDRKLIQRFWPTIDEWTTRKASDWAAGRP